MQMLRTFRLLATLAAPALITGCVSIGLTAYSAKPFEARVVDAETGQPLQGVTIVAHWELTEDSGQLMIMEAETDANGLFRFPGWGPKHIPAGVPITAEMSCSAPGLLIFKSGYQYFWEGSTIYESGPPKPGTVYERPEGVPVDYRPKPYSPAVKWDHQTITLNKYSRPKGNYQLMLGELRSVLLNYITKPAAGQISNACRWREMPKMILALRRDGADFETFLIGTDAWMIEHGCGSPKEFLRGLPQ